MATSKAPTEAKDQANERALRGKLTERLTASLDLRPAVLRLALYDAILQRYVGGLPKAGSMHYFVENERAPEELRRAIKELEHIRQSELQPESYVSYADLYQLAGVVAIRLIYGRDLTFRFGREDSTAIIPMDELLNLEQLPEGRLQGDDTKIIKDYFDRIGFHDEKEIVAIFPAILYTTKPSLFALNPSSQVGSPQVKLASVYSKMLEEYRTQGQGEKPKEGEAARTGKSSFGHWKCLVSNDAFRSHVELFAKEEKIFDEEFAKAYQKLSDVGLSRQQIAPAATPPTPALTVVDEFYDVKHGIMFAVAMTILIGFAGLIFDAMRPPIL